MLKQDRPLTTGEIAKYCHVTYRCILKWIEADKLKTFRTPGGHNRIHLRDFLNFLKAYNMPVPLEFEKKLNKRKILIVDDDKNMVNSIKRILRTQNGSFDIEVAYDGFDVGRKVAEFKPDLVILDIRMPGMDGYEVIRRIKEMPGGKHTKIIAISAYFKEDGKKNVASPVVEACLDKPFDNEELLNKVKGLIS